MEPTRRQSQEPQDCRHRHDHAGATWIALTRLRPEPVEQRQRQTTSVGASCTLTSMLGQSPGAGFRSRRRSASCTFIALVSTRATSRPRRHQSHATERGRPPTTRTPRRPYLRAHRERCRVSEHIEGHYDSRRRRQHHDNPSADRWVVSVVPAMPARELPEPLSPCKGVVILHAAPCTDVCGKRTAEVSAGVLAAHLREQPGAGEIPVADTVNPATPSASAVSSTVRPQKNRSSTTSLLRVLIVARRCKASSNATNCRLRVGDTVAVSSSLSTRWAPPRFW